MNSGAWYAPYVLWATRNNIASGYSSGSFGPGDNISREQMVLLLYRYAVRAGYESPDASAIPDAAGSFNDADKVSSWARNAVNWAVSKKLINGKPGNIIDPQGTATRAEIAAVIQRFVLMNQ